MLWKNDTELGSPPCSPQMPTFISVDGERVFEFETREENDEKEKEEGGKRVSTDEGQAHHWEATSMRFAVDSSWCSKSTPQFVLIQSWTHRIDAVVVNSDPLWNRRELLVNNHLSQQK